MMLVALLVRIFGWQGGGGAPGMVEWRRSGAAAKREVVATPGALRAARRRRGLLAAATREPADEGRYVGSALGAAPQGSPWRGHLVPGSGLAVAKGLLAAARAELRREEDASQRDRVARWHPVCTEEVAEAALFPWVPRPVVAPPQPQAAVEAVQAGWHALKREPWPDGQGLG